MTTATAPSAADLMTARQATDPYPIFDALRQETPFRAGGGMPGQGSLWPLMRYHDVYAALKDHETFSSAGRDGGGQFLVLINNDPPRHTRFRKLVSKAFTPRRIAELEPWIQQTSDELFDALGKGEVEAVEGYTMPLPVKAIAKLLGIPGEEYVTFKRWTDSLLSFGDAEKDAAARGQDMMEMFQYFAKMASLRREHGAQDLITALVEAETDEGKLEDWEVIGFCILLLVAGNETTTNLMGNMLNHLAHDPALFATLKADRDLIPQALEEMVRYESPVQVLFRTTLKDAVLPSGGRIPAGESVGIYYGAANRDPGGWGEDANTYRLDRDLKDHVGFGHGIHYCLGSPLARAEARITVNNLLDRFDRLTPGATPGVRQASSPIVYGFKTLALTLGG
ncbi:MAG: cytochrome P450 [Dehalococcoidia bacterium]